MNDSKPTAEKSDLIRGVFLLFLLIAVPAVPVQASEIYGNFETLGVIVDCPQNYSPAQITRVRLYLIDDGKRKPVQDAFQVGSERYYASSLFLKKAKWRKLIFRNNIWYGQSAGFVSWRDGLSPIDMKNDIVLLTLKVCERFANYRKISVWLRLSE